MRSIHACRKLYGAKQCLESCRPNGRAAFRAASKFSIVNIATGITEMFTCESTLRSMPMRCSRCKGTRKRGTASCRGLSGQALRQRRRRLRSPPHRRQARGDCRRSPRPGRRVRRSLRRFPRQTVSGRWRLSRRLRHQQHRRCAVRRGAVPFAPIGFGQELRPSSARDAVSAPKRGGAPAWGRGSSGRQAPSPSSSSNGRKGGRSCMCSSLPTNFPGVLTQAHRRKYASCKDDRVGDQVVEG